MAVAFGRIVGRSLRCTAPRWLASRTEEAALRPILLISALAVACGSGWYAAGPGSAYRFGVEFGCDDAAWRRAQAELCDRFDWQRTMHQRVDVAGNRGVALPGARWFMAELATLPGCSVSDRDT